ncbi:hypothetical protein D3C84_1280620 [compost metagenome]
MRKRHQPAARCSRQIVGEQAEQFAAVAPVMPIQRHIDGAVGNQFLQLAPRQLRPHLLLGH